MLLNQVGQNLGVGFGAEDVPFFGQNIAQGFVVFDDAVMDDRQLTLAVGVRVGVGVVRLAVGGPAGVGDADLCGKVVPLQNLIQH